MYDGNGTQIDEDGDVRMGGVVVTIEESSATTTTKTTTTTTKKKGPSTSPGPDLERQVVLLPCNHLFHDGCVSDWLHSNRACPLYRTKLTVFESGSNEFPVSRREFARLVSEDLAKVGRKSWIVKLALQFWQD